jgi:hypothetical protein
MVQDILGLGFRGAFRVLCGCDELPFVAILLRRHEAAVDLEHEDGVGVAQLAGDESAGVPARAARTA